MKTIFTAAMLAALCMAGAGQAHDPDPSTQIAGAHDVTVRQVYDRALPDVPGKSLRGVIVDYGPGGFSPAHHHARSALIYATVLQGAIRSQVEGAPAKVYHVGESWTEMPGDHHLVSANASATEAARLLAVFVVDTEERELTIPDGH